jgi:hypothetical protein
MIGLCKRVGFVYVTLLVSAIAVPQARAGFALGDAANFVDLFEGTGGNTLQITNVTVNGNIGVGNMCAPTPGCTEISGKATDSGPSTVNGSINFSAANGGQFSNNNNNDVITGGVNYSDSSVTDALNTVNALNTSLGGEMGTNIAVSNGGATIKTSQSLYVDGNGNAVFNVTSFSSNVGDVIKINNNTGATGVVFNFNGVSANFDATIVLNGFTADQVVWNFVGGSPFTGGPTLAINTNASSYPSVSAEGIFLDPNGAISITNANVVGRVFGGDTHDLQLVSGSTLQAPTSVPEPSVLASLFTLLGGLGVVLFRRTSALS